MQGQSIENIRIINNACYGREGLSGGDRILIELARQWAQKGIQVSLFTSRDGHDICHREGLDHVNIDYTVWWEGGVSRPLYVPLSYLVRTIAAIVKVLRMKEADTRKTVVYSGSDFWPDSLPGLVMKLKNRKVLWAAGFYLFTPKPWSKESPFRGRYRWRGLASYLGQLLAYWLVKRYADMVFVTSEPDVEKFITGRRDRSKIVTVRGGVDTKLPLQVPEPVEKAYDAVFIGRFHPQKGVLELIDIWKLVCEQKRDAKLAVIGLGPLEEEMKGKILANGLQENISLHGYLDGIPKIQVFKSSKIVVHPAIYDSGGMAACEAMSAGLPGVSFDLEALKTYYPKGMLKVPCFDFREYARSILKLLDDEALYARIKRDAMDWAGEWDWEKRADEILRSLAQNI